MYEKTDVSYLINKIKPNYRLIQEGDIIREGDLYIEKRILLENINPSLLERSFLERCFFSCSSSIGKDYEHVTALYHKYFFITLKRPMFFKEPFNLIGE